MSCPWKFTLATKTKLADDNSTSVFEPNVCGQVDKQICHCECVCMYSSMESYWEIPQGQKHPSNSSLVVRKGRIPVGRCRKHGLEWNFSWCVGQTICSLDHSLPISLHPFTHTVRYIIETNEPIPSAIDTTAKIVLSLKNVTPRWSLVFDFNSRTFEQRSLAIHV